MSPQRVILPNRIYPKLFVGDALDNVQHLRHLLAELGSRKANGVSMLHGHVTRRMWQPLWPGLPEFEVPIGHITNGVHVTSWLAPAMRQLFDRYLGSAWPQKTRWHETWTAVDRIEDEEL